MHERSNLPGKMWLHLIAVVAGVMLAMPALASPVSKRPLTLLVSIDGFRADYLGRGQTPVLARLARRGSVSAGLVPMFPSVTFPNHVSIVTGLVPDHHGIVNNTMFDPAIADPVFKLSSRTAVENPLWWNESTPVWVTAARHGKTTSAMFWPGTETRIGGIQPRDWLTYSDAMSSDERVDQLLKWLAVNPSDRADFATLYFSEVDTFGHKAGPGSRKLDAALSRVDRAMGRLLAGLRRLGLRQLTDLVIVSDHGMAPVRRDGRIDLHELLAEVPRAKLRWGGAIAGIESPDGDMPRLLGLLRPQKHMECWPKDQMPARFRFGTHRRIPPIVCLAQSGWWITDDPKSAGISGMHGYDPEGRLMRGLFIAQGRRLAAHRRLGTVQNIDVYPLLCGLIGIPPEPNDATQSLLPLMKARAP